MTSAKSGLNYKELDIPYQMPYFISLFLTDIYSKMMPSTSSFNTGAILGPPLHDKVFGENAKV